MHSFHQDLTFVCPSCKAELESSPENAGKIIDCPECGVSMQIPYPHTTSQPSAPVIRTASPPAGKSLKIKPGATRQPLTTSTRPSSSPSRKKKRKSGGCFGFAVFLLLLIGGAAALWIFVLDEEGNGIPLPRLAIPSVRPSTATSGPISDVGPQHSPTAAQSWQPGHQADVNAIEWGASGRQHIEHMVARQNGNMILTGMIPSASAVPQNAGRTTTLLQSPDPENLAFVAEVSADGQDILWYSLFGGGLLEPSRVALGPDGSIFLGGRALSHLPGSHPSIQGDFQGRESVVAKLSPDGSRLEWAREGGPNSDNVTGLAIDEQGRVLFTTGTRGRGQAAYIMRRNPDGSDSTFGEEWAIRFDVRDDPFKVPGQIGAFYEKGASGDGYDYDGPDGWSPIRFHMAGIRQGGQVLLLPDGDFVVSGTLQYDFREQGKQRFPAFDLILARFSPDGELRWSTNLYQEGDSIHTPDQKAIDLLYNPANGDLYVLAIQHGSNVYRFKGDLYGNTGNLMFTWVGQVATDTGALKNGWYWMNSRQGNYTEQGRPLSPPYPNLSGNRPTAFTVDDQGRLYFVGDAGTKAWTTPHAWRDWPAEQTGGGNAALLILAPNLDRVHYATMIRGSGHDNSSANGIVVNDQGVWVGGWNGTEGLPIGPQPAWSITPAQGDRNKMLVHFNFGSQ